MEAEGGRTQRSQARAFHSLLTIIGLGTVGRNRKINSTLFNTVYFGESSLYPTNHTVKMYFHVRLY